MKRKDMPWPAAIIVAVWTLVDAWLVYGAMSWAVIRAS